MKKLLIGLGVLALVYLVLCFVGPQRLDVSESRNMASSKGAIMNQITDLESWTNWSPWVEKDKSIVSSYGEVSQGVGAKTSWTSDHDGGGSMEIVEIKENKIKIISHFNDFDADNNITFDLNTKEDATEVVWRMTGVKDYPFLMRGMMLFFSFDKEIQADYKRGLELLEERAKETKPSNRGMKFVKKEPKPEGYFPTNSGDFEVQVLAWNAVSMVGQRKKIKRSELRSVYSALKKKAYPILARNKLVPFGAPVSLIYKEKDGVMDVFVGIPVKGEIESLKGIDVINIPQSPAFSTFIEAGYDGVEEAHKAIVNYVNKAGLAYKLPIIEEYSIHNLDENRVNEQLLTRIYYLAK